MLCRKPPLQRWASLACRSMVGVPSAHPTPCCSPGARASGAHIKTRQASGLGISHGCRALSPPQIFFLLDSVAHTCSRLSRALPPCLCQPVCLSVHALPCLSLTYCKLSHDPPLQPTTHTRAEVYLEEWSNLTPPSFSAYLASPKVVALLPVFPLLHFHTPINQRVAYGPPRLLLVSPSCALIPSRVLDASVPRALGSTARTMMVDNDGQQ